GSDSFGYSVALSADGTTALVGALEALPFRVGAAFVFHVPSAASWSTTSSPTATLSIGSGNLGQVGNAVALSADGTTALVGTSGGVAYVFHVPTEGSWSTTSSPTATLTAPDPTGFGSAVALSADGTTALVGAAQVGPNHVETGAGAAYVFHVPTEASWSTTSSPTATLTKSGGATGDWLGYSVALSADGMTSLVGAPQVSSGTGAAYLYLTGACNGGLSFTSGAAGQSARPGAFYAQALQVRLSCSGIDPGGQTISFSTSPPGDGGPTSPTAIVGSDGIATVAVVAGASSGSFTVSATYSGPFSSVAETTGPSGTFT